MDLLLLVFARLFSSESTPRCGGRFNVAVLEDAPWRPSWRCFSFAVSATVDAAILVHINGLSDNGVEAGREFMIEVDDRGLFSASDLTFGDESSMWQLLDLDVSGDTDPFASLAFTAQNNLAAPILITMSVTVPIAPQLVPSSIHGGSTGGSVTDANADGSASVTTAFGTPFFSGELDGSTVLALHGDPSSFNVNFAGGTSNITAVSAGLPGPTLPSGAVLNTIGITNTFVLSPGDIASVTSFFQAEIVPEPASLMLVLLAVAGLAPRRR